MESSISMLEYLLLMSILYWPDLPPIIYEYASSRLVSPLISAATNVSPIGFVTLYLRLTIYMAPVPIIAHTGITPHMSSFFLSLLRTMYATGPHTMIYMISTSIMTTGDGVLLLLAAFATSYP